MLTLRSRNILKFLASSPSPVKVKELSLQFQVSERTIKYDLDLARSWLAEEKSLQVRLTSRPRLGVALSGDAGSLLKLSYMLNDQDESSPLLHPKERVKHIALELLTNDGYVTLEALSNRTQVSKNTALADLTGAAELLAPWNVELERKAHWGYRVRAAEIKRRLAIEYLILTLLDGCEIALLLQNLGEAETPAPIHKILRRFLLCQEDASRVYRSFSRIVPELRRLGGGLPEERMSVGLLVRLCVSVGRVRSGAVLNEEIPGPGAPGRKLTDELEALFSRLGLPLGKREAAFLTAPFMGGDAPQIEADLAGIVTDLARRVGALSAIPFLSDGELYENLLSHIRDKTARHQYGVIDPNPLLGGVVRYYGALFNIVRQVAYDVFGSIGVLLKDEDIAYLVLHFQASYERRFGKRKFRALVVCGTGRGAAKLLRARLENEIDALHITGCCSVLDLEEALNWQPVDLVVSVLPLDTHLPHVAVSALLSEQNIAQIQKLLDTLARAGDADLQAAAREPLCPAEQMPRPELISQEIIGKGFQLGLALSEAFAPHLDKQAQIGLTLHALLMANRMAFGSPYAEFSRKRRARSPETEALARRARQIVGQYYKNVPESEIEAILHYLKPEKESAT